MTDIQPLETFLSSLKEDIKAVPDETFRKNARIRILNSVVQTTNNIHHNRATTFITPLRFAFLTMLFISWTLYAAQASSTNNPLYPVKILGERIALSLAPTSSIKTSIANTIVDRRLEEIQEAQNSGDKNNISKSVVNYDRDVEKILRMPNVSQEKIENTISRHSSLIQKIHKEENIPQNSDTKTDGESEKPDKPQNGRYNEDTHAPTPTPFSQNIQLRQESVSPSTENNEGQLPEVRGDDTQNSKEH